MRRRLVRCPPPARASHPLRNRCLLVHSGTYTGQCWDSCLERCSCGCDFFGGFCDCDACCGGYYDCAQTHPAGHATCDSDCDVGCSACSSGYYGAAEQVTCGPRAVAQPPDTHTPRPCIMPPLPPLAYPRRRHPGVQQQWCSDGWVLCVHQQACELILHGWLNHERMPVQVQRRVLP